ncbi:MAG: hypothetical protein O7D91_17710 [Planctomycetota bacterium]|nr:hypothetical protein [Planctomycetota bacterium]
MISKHGLLCFQTGGPTFEIEAGGKKFLFEWNRYGGPTILDRRNHNPTGNQPRPKSPFWDAIDSWNKQGRRVADGLCVWDQA